MKEQVYIKSYEDSSYIGVELDGTHGFTTNVIPNHLALLSKMDFDTQIEEIKKFPENQIRFVDSEKELSDTMACVRYTHVVYDNHVVSYNCDGDIV